MSHEFGTSGGGGTVGFGNRSFGPIFLYFEMGTVLSRSIMQVAWSIRESSRKMDLKKTLLPTLWVSVSSFLFAFSKINVNINDTVEGSEKH